MTDKLTDTPTETGPSEDAAPVRIDDDTPVFDGTDDDYRADEPDENEHEPEEDDDTEVVG